MMKLRGFNKAILIAVFLLVLILTIRSLYKIITTSAPDFSVLWISAKDLLLGDNPYTNSRTIYPYFLPPITAIFYLPLVFLPFKLAEDIFIILSFSLIIACIYLTFKIIFKEIPKKLFILVCSLTLISFPTKFTLGMGQVNFFSFFLLLASYVFFLKKRIFKSSLLFVLSIISKPIFLFFILFFFLKRAWKFVLFTSIFLLLFLLLSFLISGTTVYFDWFNRVLSPILHLTGREVYYNQGLSGFVFRIFPDFFMNKFVILIISFVVIFITSLLLIKKNHDINLHFSNFIITLLLVDTLSWQHHFVWLIFPFVVSIKYGFLLRKKIFWILLLISFLLISWNFKNPEHFYSFPLVLVLSNTFLGSAILFLLNIYLLIKKNKYLS